MTKREPERFGQELRFFQQFHATNIETHPEFGEALKEAEKAGVKVLFLLCEITKGEIKINLCVEKKS